MMAVLRLSLHRFPSYLSDRFSRAAVISKKLKIAALTAGLERIADIPLTALHEAANDPI
jgi:hypothetical protein